MFHANISYNQWDKLNELVSSIYAFYAYNFLLLPGKTHPIVQDLHITTALKFPQVVALKLPTNFVDVNASEIGRFSPLRERDISGPVINSCYTKQNNMSKIDITVQADPHVNKYDCSGALSLSSSMQSNVPTPFTGNHTHLGMPGSQWGQGHKYLSDHLHNAHYLTLRNEYRARMLKQGMRYLLCLFPSILPS